MPAALRNALVWCLLVLVPAGYITLNHLESEQARSTAEAHPEQAPSDALGGVTVLQGRLLTGLAPQGLDNDDPLGTRPMARLAAAMLLARAGQAERAEAQWKLATEAGADAPEAALADAVHRLIGSWPQASEGKRPLREGVLDEAQWKLVQQHMGWFGEVARADFTGDATAQERAFGSHDALLLTMILAGVWFFGVGLLGLVAMLTLVIVALSGRIRSAIATLPRVQSILGETFVVWMLLFMGGHLALGHLGDQGEPSAGRIWIGMASSFASLSALWWPRWRGLTWAEIREAAGLRWQGGALKLAWMSATSYACALPCMAAGILLGMLLADWLGGRSFQDVRHPVQDLLPSADGHMRLALFALASVGAPIVEEIAFRGLLYGHARQQSARWPRALSIALAMLFSATVFAAIHPQGVLAVPALAALSFGFCITREWSGSVLPGMIAHGLHNGLLLALNLALQSA